MSEKGVVAPLPGRQALPMHRGREASQTNPNKAKKKAVKYYHKQGGSQRKAS